MDWRDWELFCEVVEHGGFSAAARVLGHPKSSLSAAVQRLESNLGLRLIERTTRHLRLTDAGETIYQRVKPLFIVFAMLEAPLPSTRIVITRVSSLERGLFAAPALLEKFGEPRTLADLARLPMLTAPNDAPWALTTPAGLTEHLAVAKARLVSSNADIRLQAALAGHGVLRVTASFTSAAVEAGLLRRILPDHVCEPLSVHALLPARQFVPAKVRCFLDALEAHARNNAAAKIDP